MNFWDENFDKQIYHVFCSDWINRKGTTKLYVVYNAVKYVCETRTFQNGGTTHTPRSHPTDGLDDKIGSERCLPSDTNPHRPSTPSPVPLGKQTYQFRCLPFRLTSAPRVFSKVMKLVVGALQHIGICLIIYLDDLLVLHQSMEELAQLTPLICQLFKALGLVINQKRSILMPRQNLEFLGFQVDIISLQLIFPAEKLRKIQQLAQHLLHQPSEGFSEVCGENLSVNTGHMASSSTFQSTTVFDQLCSSRGRPHGDRVHRQQIQQAPDIDYEAKNDLEWWCALDRKVRMQSPLQSQHDDRVEYLQHRMESSTRQAPDRWKVIPRGNFPPHKLS